MRKTICLLTIFSFVINISFAQISRREYPQKKSLAIENSSFELKKDFLIPTKGSSTLNEDFEGNFPPEDWIIIDNDNDRNNWESGKSPQYSTHSGNKCAISYSWKNIPLNPNNYLITPPLTIKANDSITWWVATQDKDFPAEKYRVLVSVTEPTIESFTTEIFSETLTIANVEWQERKINLSQFVGENIYIAFVQDSVNQFVLKIDDVSGPEIFHYDYDLTINNPVCNYSIKTPFNHFSINGFEASARNKGKNDITNIKLNLYENSTLLHQSSSISILQPSETSNNLVITDELTSATIGEHTFTLTVVSDENNQEENLVNNSATFTITATDTVFATDYDIILGGVGSYTSTIEIGNVYTLKEKDTLTSITAGFASVLSELDFEIAVYKIERDSILKEIFSKPVKRTLAMEDSKENIFTFNPQILDAGKYFVSARQLTKSFLDLAIDMDINGYFYGVYKDTICRKYANPTMGNILLRANFGQNPTLIYKDVAIESIAKPLEHVGMFSASEEIIVKIKNYGISSLTNIPVTCQINNNTLPVQTIPNLEPNTSVNITFTYDLSTLGSYDITIFTGLVDDEIKSNDTIEKTIKTAAILWDFNNGMPDSFSLIRIDSGIVSSYIAPVFPQNNAWTIVSDDKAGRAPLSVASPSWFTDAKINANRWMITPFVNLTVGNTLEWDAKSVDRSDFDGYEVRISTTGLNPSDFDKILFSTEEESATWTMHDYDLSAYNDQSVAFAFVQNSADGVILLIDNISIHGNATVGINDLENINTSINIFPNPAKNYVEINSQEKIVALKVLNTTGQIVNQLNNIKSYNYTLNTSNIKAGVYFIQIDTEKGQISKKLVITK